MPAYVNFVAIGAARNGTTTHTVDPSSATGVVAGTPFTPTAGRRLVVVAEGAVTSTTPSGWTLPSGGSAVNQTGLYVWHRVAAGADTFATTHNASNYPVGFAVFEFPASTTFIGSVSATAQNATAANPNLTGLTGTNTVMGVAAWVDNFPGNVMSGTWNSPNVEVLDTNVDDGATDGYWLGVCYQDGYASASYQPTPTITVGGSNPNCERLTFAVKPPASGTTYERAASVDATAAITAAATFFSVFERSSAVGATAAITTAPQRALQRSAAITATAAITAAPQRALLRQAAVAAAASIATAPQRDLQRQTAVAATAAITVAGEIEAPGATTHERSASLSSAAAITAAGTFYTILARAVALNATAAVTSAPQRALLRSAAITATAAVTAAGQIEGGAATHERAAALSASAAITAAATFWSVLERASALTATAAVTVAYRRELQRQAAVTATGAITIAHQRYLNRTAGLTAASLITTGWQIGEIPDVLLYLTYREHAALTHTERANPVFREHAHLTLRR